MVGAAAMSGTAWGNDSVRRSRVRGCLLGGAIGDALGNPVEFLSLAGIRRAHGEQGVRGLTADEDGVAGRVTDDTQMTLFTAEGLIRAHSRAMAKGIGGAETAVVRHAYLRWLDTQNHPAPPDPEGDDIVRTGWLRRQPWLYARRAPGNACLTGLAAGYTPDPRAPLGEPGPVNTGSKGCGTVMRSAPFGLTGRPASASFGSAARCAQITHGHPTGAYAAGTLAAIVAHLLDGDSLPGSVLRAMELLARHPGHEETTAALRAAVELAAQGAPSAEKVESLGAGCWPRRRSPSPCTAHWSCRAPVRWTRPCCSPSTTRATATPPVPSAATCWAPATATYTFRRPGWCARKGGR